MMGKYSSHTAEVSIQQGGCWGNHMLTAWYLMGNCYTETKSAEHFWWSPRSQTTAPAHPHAAGTLTPLTLKPGTPAETVSLSSDKRGPWESTAVQKGTDRDTHTHTPF